MNTLLKKEPLTMQSVDAKADIVRILLPFSVTLTAIKSCRNLSFMLILSRSSLFFLS